MRISVIMPVNLQPYQAISEGVLIKSASNPEIKFIRAVNSFVFQAHPDKELIVVHDGCRQSEKILKLQFGKQIESGLIKSVFMAKQPLYSGALRNKGIEKASGEIIAYLDADDGFMEHHLSTINSEFKTAFMDWVFFNDFIAKDLRNNIFITREAELKKGHIGTSNIAHKKSLNVSWPSAYGHDFLMIEKYLLPKPGVKIMGAGYAVCHFHATGTDL